MMNDERFHWDELSSSEVVARLEQLDRAGQPPVSDFLDIHQWLPLVDRPGQHVDGGYPEAQLRRVALGQPDSITGFYHILPDSLPANARTAHGARVMLGKAAGRQGLIGDAALGTHLALVAAPGILDDLEGITAQATGSWSPPDLAVKRTTAAANRLDAVVAATFQISRDEAQTALKFRFVFLNFQPVSKRTTTVAAGDTVIFRSKGKVRIIDLGPSKSGRCRLEVVQQPI